MPKHTVKSTLSTENDELTVERSLSDALSPGPFKMSQTSQSDDDGSDDETCHFRYFLEDVRLAAHSKVVEEREVNPLRRLLHNEYDSQTLESLHDHISRIEMRLGHLERGMSKSDRNCDRASKVTKNQYYGYEQINRYEDVEASFCSKESSQDENNVTVLFSKCWTIPQLRLVRPGRVVGAKHVCQCTVDNEPPSAESSLLVRPLRMKGGACGTYDKKCHCCCGGEKKKKMEEKEIGKCPITKGIRHTPCCCRCPDNQPLPAEPGPEKKSWCCRNFKVNYPRLVWKRRSQSDKKAQGCGDCRNPSGDVSKALSEAKPAPKAGEKQAPATAAKLPSPTSEKIAQDEEEEYDEEDYGEEEETVHAVIVDPRHGASGRASTSAAPKKKGEAKISAARPRKAIGIEIKERMKKVQTDVKVEKTRKKPSKKDYPEKLSFVLSPPQSEEKRKLPNSVQTDTVQLPPSISNDESAEEVVSCDKATSIAPELLSPCKVDKETLKIEALSFDTKENASHGEACDCAVCTHWKEITSAIKFNEKQLAQINDVARDNVSQKSYKEHVEGCKCSLCMLTDTNLAHNQEDNPLRDHLRYLEKVNPLEEEGSFEKLLAKKTKAHRDLCHCTICNQRRRIEILRRKLNEEMESTEYFLRNNDSLSERNVSRLVKEENERQMPKLASKEWQRDNPDMVDDYAIDTEEHIHKPRRRQMSEDCHGHSGKTRKRTYGKGYITSDGRRGRWWSSTSRRSRRHGRQTKHTAMPYRKRTNSRSSMESGHQSRCSKHSFTVCDCRYCKVASEKEVLHAYESGHKHKDYDAFYKQTSKYGHGEYDHLLKSDKNGVTDSYPALLKNRRGTSSGPGKRRGKWRESVDVDNSDDEALSSTGCEASCSGKCKLKLNPWTDFRQIGLRIDKPLERECSRKSKIVSKVTGWNTRNLQEEKLRGSSSNSSTEAPTNDNPVGVTKVSNWRDKTGSKTDPRYVPLHNSRLESRMEADSRARLKRQISNNWPDCDDDDVVLRNQKSRSVPEWSS